MQSEYFNTSHALKTSAPRPSENLVPYLSLLVVDGCSLTLANLMTVQLSLASQVIFFVAWTVFRAYRGLFASRAMAPHIKLRVNLQTSFGAILIAALTTEWLPLNHIPLTHITVMGLLAMILSMCLRPVARSLTWGAAGNESEGSAPWRDARLTAAGYALQNPNSEMIPGQRRPHQVVMLNTLKYTFDRLLGGMAVAALLPLFLGLSWLIRMGSAGPAVYASQRLGRNGQTFACYKFRTMYLDAEERLEELLQADENLRLEYATYHKLRVDPRVTPIGRILRKTSLDELPQLVNVALGQMSLVGPRPYLPREANKMQDAAPFILSVKPGLTGYWQVKGRGTSTFEERIDMDCHYVHRWDLWWDFTIILETVKTVLWRKGAF